MTFGSTRAALTLGATLAVSASLLLTPGTAAQAAGTPLAGSPTLKSLGITGQVQDMVVAGGKVWVSWGNEVDVFSTSGAKLSSVTGLLGASDLLASADGSSVYVAAREDARIATLSTTSMSQTATWPTSPCPTHLALAGGRLFYAYGCASTQGALASVDPATGSAGPVVAENLYYTPWISGGSSTLVAVVLGISPGTATSYTVSPDGSVTRQAGAEIATSGDFAVSPDGSQVIMTGGYQTMRRYRTSDLSVNGSFATSTWNSAVAYAPDGSRFAGASDGSFEDTLRVFDNTSSTLTSRSTGDRIAGTVPTVVAGTLQFSANSTLLYGIAQPSGQAARLVTATAQTVSAGRVAATVSSPSAYGKTVTVKVTVGRPTTRVTVRATLANGDQVTVSKVTGAAGTVSIPVSARFSGRLTVTLAGDLRHAAATTAAKAYTVPAKLALTVSGAYSSRSGMQHFHQMSAVKVPVRVSPNRALTAKYLLQAKVGGKWKTLSSTTFTANGDNTNYLAFTSATKHVPYRFVGTFAGDGYNSKAPTATSKTIIID